MNFIFKILPFPVYFDGRSSISCIHGLLINWWVIRAQNIRVQLGERYISYFYSKLLSVCKKKKKKRKKERKKCFFYPMRTYRTIAASRPSQSAKIPRARSGFRLKKCWLYLRSIKSSYFNYTTNKPLEYSRCSICVSCSVYLISKFNVRVRKNRTLFLVIYPQIHEAVQVFQNP